MFRVKVICRRYSTGNLQHLEKGIKEHDYRNINHVNLSSVKDTITDKYGGDEHHFNLCFNLKENKNASDQLCAALIELESLANGIERGLKNEGMDKNATVTFDLQISDKEAFESSLQNVIGAEKLIFGNVFKREYFNTVFFANQPQNEFSQKILEEQTLIRDIDDNVIFVFDHHQAKLSVWFVYGRKRAVNLAIDYASIARIIVVNGNGKYKGSIICQLKAPPTIFTFSKAYSYETGEEYVKRGRFFTWDTQAYPEYDISTVSCVAFDCSNFNGQNVFQCLNEVQKNTGLGISIRQLSFSQPFSYKSYAKNVIKQLNLLPESLQKLSKEKYFPLLYMVEALTTRGGEIYDHFFRGEGACFLPFLKRVVETFEDDVEHFPTILTKTVWALEKMLDKVDVLLDQPNPIEFFNQIYENQRSYDTSLELAQKMQDRGYVRIYKVIKTPTRILLCNPDTVMGNRFVRNHKNVKFVHVLFRDENMSQLYGSQAFLLNKTMDNFFKYAKIFAMQKFFYLGASDAQLRDHGCFLTTAEKEEIEKGMTLFEDDQNLKPSWLVNAFGKCLMPSRKHSIEIGAEHFFCIKNKNKIYKENVGIMTKEFAKTIATKLGYPDFIPTCVQFGFRGYFGILVLDVYGYIAEEERKWNMAKGELKFAVRKSQKHFNFYSNSFEIIKVSFPCSVVFHTPLINILDQVLKKQNALAHEKFKRRMLGLLENNIDDIVSTLVDSEKAVSMLSGVQKLIDVKNFENIDFNDEPFFRSVILSAASFRTEDLVKKTKIRIPASAGRVMLGVVDEKGILEAGQVFVCFTKGVDVKFPSESAEKSIHIGKVLVAKKFSYTAGDVRVFEAVDVKYLHDLVDVIVFSKRDGIPNYKEITGADLFGEESFTVIWDEAFLLDKNEDATNVDINPMETHLQENGTFFSETFIKEFVANANVGSYANAYLVNSDLYGIFSTTCSNIALKICQASKFSKTAKKPAGLSYQAEDGLPAEKIEVYPNFMRKNFSTMYKSVNLLGDIHLRLKEFYDLMKLRNVQKQENGSIDSSLIVQGDEVYANEAKTKYSEYSELIQNVLDVCGIKGEGELFSHRFNVGKNGLSERNENETTMFDAYSNVKERLADICEMFRRDFFNEFNGIETVTVLEEGIKQSRETFARKCKNPSLKIRQKASAYYRIAYTDKKYLSFAWVICSDVLMVNRKEWMSTNEENCTNFEQKLTNFIKEAFQGIWKTEFEKFCQYLKHVNQKEVSLRILSYKIGTICESHSELSKLLFLIRKWFEKCENVKMSVKCLDAIAVKIIVDSSTSWSLTEEGIGKKFMDFIRHISNKNSWESMNFDLTDITAEKVTIDDRLVLFNWANETLYFLALDRDFNVLLNGRKKYEGGSFVVELPLENAESSEDNESLLRKFAKKCGCEYIVIKKKIDFRREKKTTIYIVKAIGHFWNVFKFQQILMPTFSTTEASNNQKINELIANNIYHELLKK